MARLVVDVLFEEGDEVYFKVDQEKTWMVVGHTLSNGQILYMVSTPELGIYEATGQELTTERTIF